MLFHLSFTACDTDRVSAVVAELLGATVVAAPSPPFPAGSRLVCCFDERGTLVEILPAGTAYRPGPGAAPRAIAEPVAAAAPAASGVHGLFLSPLTVEQIEGIARREGWPVGLVDPGPFQVVAVWLEGAQLIELTTQELLPGYVAFYGRAGRDALEPTLRALEAQVRAALASGHG
ncbi:MAG TPA: hypothetical protein VNO33_16785 [Kofleriaceae bacterium]|nr:hypothetical protein [Kofleriaceae bacterium]